MRQVNKKLLDVSYKINIIKEKFDYIYQTNYNDAKYHAGLVMSVITDFTFEGGEPISLQQAFKIINSNFDAVTTITRTAMEDIPPNSVCYIDELSQVLVAGSNIEESRTHTKFFAPNATLAGNQVTLHYPNTPVCLTTFNNLPGRYWLGENGVLVSEIPDTGYTVLVGEAVTLDGEFMLYLNLTTGFVF